MPIVYAAGPISGLTSTQACRWRRKLAQELRRRSSGVQVLSPMRGKERLFQGPINDQSVRSLVGDYERLITSDRGITARDRYDIQRCDVVFMNLLGADHVSIGTMIELGWADSLRKPVVVLMEKKNNPHDHPMLRDIACYITDRWDLAVSLTAQILGLVDR